MRCFTVSTFVASPNRYLLTTLGFLNNARLADIGVVVSVQQLIVLFMLLFSCLLDTILSLKVMNAVFVQFFKSSFNTFSKASMDF